MRKGPVWICLILLLGLLVPEFGEDEPIELPRVVHHDARPAQRVRETQGAETRRLRVLVRRVIGRRRHLRRFADEERTRMNVDGSA